MVWIIQKIRARCYFVFDVPQYPKVCKSYASQSWTEVLSCHNKRVDETHFSVFYPQEIVKKFNVNVEQPTEFPPDMFFFKQSDYVH